MCARVATITDILCADPRVSAFFGVICQIFVTGECSEQNFYRERHILYFSILLHSFNTEYLLFCPSM
jgi:hypothetical protein